jgi:hypothetical protein
VDAKKKTGDWRLKTGDWRDGVVYVRNGVAEPSSHGEVKK